MRVHWVHIPTWALIAGLAVFSWFSWNRPVQVVHDNGLSTAVSQPLPEGQVRTIVEEAMKGVKFDVTITAPDATHRQLEAPTLTLTEEQRAQAEARSPLTLHTVRIHDCVHPDLSSLPDPTCGKPVNPDTVFVREPNGEFVAIQTPDETRTTQLGPTTTTALVPPNPSTDRFGAGLGAMFICNAQGCGGVAGPDAQWRHEFSPSFFNSMTLIFDVRGSGVGGMDVFNFEW